jgi:hypothetical protein
MMLTGGLVMNKLIVGGCFCVLVFCSGWAFSQQSLDASNWRELGKIDDLARIMYVKGYLAGYSDGDSAMEKITVVLMKDNPMDDAKKKLVVPQATRVSQLSGFGVINPDITIGKIKDTISSFYGDYKNAPTCWNQALQFAVWSLNSDAPTEQELSEARKGGAESGCK